MRGKGCLALPSTRTLRDYTHYNSTNIGFSVNTDKELLRVTEKYETWQRKIVLIMDEMYICEGVVYDKHSGQIIGFMDMGDITNHLMRFIKFT